jgi:hypothetical protein
MVCLESFLLAVAVLFVEKIRQSDALFCFGLRIVGFLHSQAVISRTIVDFPAFLEHGSAEKGGLCTYKQRWAAILKNVSIKAIPINIL